jgi:hypothetical protein
MNLKCRQITLTWPAGRYEPSDGSWIEAGMGDTTTTAVDYLKYLVALCITITEPVQGDLGDFDSAARSRLVTSPPCPPAEQAA